MTYALTQVVEGANGTGHAAQALEHPSAGKTGTHEDKSAWYCGYTAQLATSVALFRTDYAADVPTMESLDGVEGFESTTGGRFPAAIWVEFMKKALEDEEVVEFPERADVGEVINPSPTPIPTPTPTATPTPTPTPSERPGRGEGNGPGGGNDSGGDESGGDTGNDWGGDESGDDPTPTPTPTPTDPCDSVWCGGNDNGNDNGRGPGGGNDRGGGGNDDDGTFEP